jgi:hypothetical protein
MNLLDKYILEVGKHLPQKNRLDLQTEIRSTIEDMLEDRSQQSGKPVDEALISEVLLEYGAPSKVADAYKPTQFLIGPRLFPFFEMVLKIVLSVLVVIALIGFGINIVNGSMSGPAFITALGNHGLQLMTGLITAFGNIVLVFAILERVLPATEFEKDVEKWSPADLDAEPDPDQVKRVELIFEILFTMLGLALFNLYPSLIGFAMVKDNTWVYVPALSDAFFRYLPWINLLGVLQILLDLYLLRRGIWQTATRLFALVVEVAGILLAGIMLVGPSLISVNAEKLAETLGEASGSIIQLLNTIPLIVLVILIVVQSIEALQIIWRLVNRPKLGKAFLPK